MMLVWVLVLTALLVSIVAGRNSSLEVEETEWDFEKLPSSKGPCDENWFYYAPLNSCFRFFCEQRSWMEAEEFCNNLPHYSELASVISKDHNTFIYNVISAVSKTTAFAWIGLNDRCKEGTYTWIDGSTWKFRYWASGQPDNYGGVENCVQFKYQAGAGWNDFSCNSKLGFVCSYKRPY